MIKKQFDDFYTGHEHLYKDRESAVLAFYEGYTCGQKDLQPIVINNFINKLWTKLKKKLIR